MVEEPSYHEDIGLRGFGFNVFDKDEEGVVKEGHGETVIFVERSIKLVF